MADMPGSGMPGSGMFEYWLLGPVVLRTIPKQDDVVLTLRVGDVWCSKRLTHEEVVQYKVDTSAGLDLLERMVAECRRGYEGNDTRND